MNDTSTGNADTGTGTSGHTAVVVTMFVVAIVGMTVLTTAKQDARRPGDAVRYGIRNVWNASFSQADRDRIPSFSTRFAAVVATPSGAVVAAPNVTRSDCEELLADVPLHVSAVGFMPGRDVPVPNAETMPTLYIPGTLSASVACTSDGTMLMRVAKPSTEDGLRTP